jgi:hypothetical protein
MSNDRKPQLRPQRSHTKAASVISNLFWRNSLLKQASWPSILLTAASFVRYTSTSVTEPSLTLGPVYPVGHAFFQIFG